MGSIHPDVSAGHLAYDPRERPIIEFFVSDFDVTWAAQRTGYGTTVSAYFLNPGKDIKELFGFAGELLLLYTSHGSVQGRTLQLAERILGEAPASGRVDPLVIILVSPAQDLEHALSRLMADSRASRIAIPFRQNECVNIRDSMFLRRRLQEHLFSRDLFDVTQPISSDLYFFGRRSIVVDLRDSARNGENTGLFGLRKTGKTSVLFKLKRVMDHDGKCKFAYLDLQDSALYSLRWWQLMDVMRKELLGGRNFNESSEEDAARSFREAVKEYAKRNPNRKVVFALHEIEHITPGLSMRPHWRCDFLDLWKTLRAIQNENRNICFLVSGVNASCIETPTYEGHDNPLFSMVKVRYMPPFEVEDITTLVQTLGRVMGMHFSDGAINYLRDTFGGHPLLTRMACSWVHKHALVGARPAEVTAEVFVRDARECNGSLWPLGHHVLGMLHKWYPEEHHMLECLAKGETKTFEEYAEAMPQCVEHLKAYRLVAQNPTRITIPFLTEFLKSYEKSGAAKSGNAAEDKRLKNKEVGIAELLEISELRNRLEPKLRRYIKRVLKAHLGPDKWIGPLLKTVPSGERERLEGVDKDMILRDRLYLTNLLQVVDQNWEFFKGLEATVPTCRVTKANFATLLAYVNTHREDAHAKQVSHADLVTLKIVVSAIENAINQFLDD